MDELIYTKYSCGFCHNQWEEAWTDPEIAPAKMVLMACQKCYPNCTVGERISFSAWDRAPSALSFADLHLKRRGVYTVKAVAKHPTVTLLTLEGFPAREFNARLFCPEYFNRAEKEILDASKQQPF